MRLGLFLFILITVVCIQCDWKGQSVDRLWGSYQVKNCNQQDYFATLYQQDESRILMNNLAGEGLMAEGEITGDIICFEPQLLSTAYGGNLYFHGWISLDAGRYYFSFVPAFAEELAEYRLGDLKRL